MRYYLAVVVKEEKDVVVVFPVSVFFFAPVSLFFTIESLLELSPPNPDIESCLQNILPSLEIVQQVWRGARACLHEPPPSPEEGGAPEK